MATVSMRSFAGGEISPALYARVDTAKYQTGLRTLKNWFVLRHGGVSTRPGTKYVCEIKDSTATARLLPYYYSSTDNYVLVLQDQFFQIVKSSGVVVNPSVNISSIAATGSDPYTVGLITTGSAHGLTTGTNVYLAGITGYEELNGRIFLVASAPTTTTFTITDMGGNAVIVYNSSSASASGGTSALVETNAIGYETADLFDLKYIQTADGMVISHPDFVPSLLVRGANDYSWAINGIDFDPNIARPASVSVSATAGSNSYTYGVTAVNAGNFEESFIRAATTGTYTAPTPSATHDLTWIAVSGVAYYNVYIDIGDTGLWGFIGTATTNAFSNWGVDPDYSIAPPEELITSWASNDYPSAVGAYQQRLMLGASPSEPEATWVSRTGIYDNMTYSRPYKDSDAFQFRFYGLGVNNIEHYIDVGKLVVMTNFAEWVLDGDANGLLTPTAISPRQNSQYGSSKIKPIISGDSILFVQSRGSIIRDLNYSFADSGYNGNDLTIFSSHFFDDYTVVDWAYQKTPHSVIWVVRDDGIVLSLTYVREHQVWGWAQHDFGGTVESVTVIPEGSEDAVYFLIKRTIDGRVRRYVERLTKRDQTDVKEYVCMDCASSYDGRNTTAVTMTISGGTDWDEDETLTLTASSGTFVSADVGKEVHIYYDTDEVLRLSIEAYSSSTVVTVRPNKTVPASLRATATDDWGLAVNRIAGLDFLEGEEVSVYGDGYVVASPNNAAYGTALTVTNGIIDLPDHYAYVHVGLPFIADFETLDIDTPSGETLADKSMLVSNVTLHLEKTRGLFVGAKVPEATNADPLDGMTELKLRDDEDYDDPVDLYTGKVDINIFAEWNKTGRVGVRQVDPVPARILAAMPAGKFPFRG